MLNPQDMAALRVAAGRTKSGTLSSSASFDVTRRLVSEGLIHQTYDDDQPTAYATIAGEEYLDKYDK